MGKHMTCTLFPEGDWGHCCGEHDKAYAKGSGVPRKQADEALRDCAIAGGRPHVAKLLYAGTRAFGWLFYRGDK